MAALDGLTAASDKERAWSRKISERCVATDPLARPAASTLHKELAGGPSGHELVFSAESSEAGKKSWLATFSEDIRKAGARAGTEETNALVDSGIEDELGKWLGRNPGEEGSVVAIDLRSPPRTCGGYAPAIPISMKSLLEAVFLDFLWIECS